MDLRHLNNQEILLLGELADTLKFGILLGCVDGAQIDGSYLASSLQDMFDGGSVQTACDQDCIDMLKRKLNNLTHAQSFGILEEYKGRSSVKWS